MTSLTPHHTNSSWTWRWRRGTDEFEISYVPGRERWLSRARYEGAGWNAVQQMNWPVPENLKQAAQMVSKHAGMEAPHE